MMRGLFLAGVVAILSACDAGSRPSPAASPTGLRSVATSAPTPASDAANGISFQRPADWRVSQPNHHDPLTDGPLLYLSTDALLPECAVGAGASPPPAHRPGPAGGWAPAALSPGGGPGAWGPNPKLPPLSSGGG